MNESEFAELAAGHALSALSPADERAYQDALVAHPEWSTLVRVDADTAALLAETTDPVTPPATVRDGLLERIASMPQDEDAAASTRQDEDAAAPTPQTDAADTDDTHRATPGGWGVRRWFTLAASVVLLLGLGFGAVIAGQYLNRPAAVVALEQIEQAPDAQTASVELGDGGEATAHWSASLGRAVLVSDGLPTLESDQTFELWFVRDGEPLSGGVFAASDGDATAALQGTYEPGDVIAVTVEPAGGAPNGQPSGAPIFAIATA